MTTPPHIEKAAREIMKRRNWADDAIELQQHFNAGDWTEAVADATLVWNLAIEEAAIATKSIDDMGSSVAMTVLFRAEAAIRALSVEG